MGITGLIPFCEQATTPILINQLKGSTVAVDSFCYLHKGSYSCADKLVKGIKTNDHINYCLKYVKMLLSFNIRVVMVFDGRNLPAKAQTELSRRTQRDTAKEKAKEFLRAGKTEEARKEFAKAVDITYEHAVQLMRECRKLGVDCITAIYEADSQLAYLNKFCGVDYIISEDSDLILFGCQKIIFKLQLDSRCLLFEADKLHLTIGVPPEKFSFEKFRRICILSGCDYLKSLPGIGLGKAKKFILMTEEDDMKRALPKLPSYLNMRKLEITEEYIDGFLKAEATFKFMYVFDPRNRKMVRLNEIEKDDPEIEHCANAGELLDPRTAYQLALGNINPRSFAKMDDFDPDTTETKFKSIWGSKQVQQSMKSFLTSPTHKNKQLLEVQNIMEQENDVTSGVEIDELVTSYACSASGVTSVKRRNSEMENEPTVKSPVKNPFAKRHQTEAEKKKLQTPTSMLKTVNKCKEVRENHRVVSRFFCKETVTRSETPKISEKDEQDMLRVTQVNEEIQQARENFYKALLNGRRDEDERSDGISSTQEVSEDSNDQREVIEDVEEEKEEVEEVIDIEKFEFKVKTQKQTFINDIKPKAAVKSKPKPKPTSQKTENSSIQTKLSKFGFQKRMTAYK